jgi:hypothetical protein
MSHYLQRLAASALQPGGNVHPILDPVFAKRSPWAGAPLEEDLAVASRSQGAAPPEPADSTAEIGGRQPAAHKDPQPATFMLPQPATVDPAETPGESVPATRPTSSDAQLSPAGTSAYAPRHRPGTGSLTNHARTAADEKPRDRAIEGQPVQPTGEFRGASDQLESLEQQQSLAPRAPTPLVPEALHHRFAKPTRLQVAGPRPGEAFGTDRRTSEPDEIQIHIGRIEVTAVQAGPPTQVAPRPARWSPSLKEYLRRRDRKSS